MKIIERADLDIQKWDALVERSGGVIFSCSFYLDAVAENWCVLVDEFYSAGMALPYTIRAGQRTLYTPVFVRYLEWFGAEFKELESQLKKHFRRADFCIRTAVLKKGRTLIYQEILPGTEWKTNELSGRMLKKFAKSEILTTTEGNSDQVLDLIRKELLQKVDSLDEKAIHRLKRLLEVLKEKGILETVTAVKQGEFLGGAYFMHFGDRVIYLKSAFHLDAKKSGVMYAVVSDHIIAARDKHLIFDFGGSRVSSVRQFNSNLGGTDVIYYQYDWDESPVWFKLLLNLRKLLRNGWKSSSTQKM